MSIYFSLVKTLAPNTQTIPFVGKSIFSSGLKVGSTDLVNFASQGFGGSGRSVSKENSESGTARQRVSEPLSWI